MEKIITEGTKIYLALEPVDMRKGFSGLYAQVSEHLKLKPLSGVMPEPITRKSNALGRPRACPSSKTYRSN